MLIRMVFWYEMKPEPYHNRQFERKISRIFGPAKDEQYRTRCNRSLNKGCDIWISVLITLSRLQWVGYMR